MLKIMNKVAGYLNVGYRDLTSRIMFMIFIFMFVPVLVITVFSSLYLQDQFSRNQDHYLHSTLAMALSEMQQRQEDIRRAALVTAQDVSTQRAVSENDIGILVQKIALLQKNFNKVDYAVIVDPKNGVIARSGANIRFNPDGPLGVLNQEAAATGNAITSNETIPLGDLFAAGSEEYKKFIIQLKKGIAGEGEIMHQALCEVTTVPIINNKEPDKVMASLILIGICNSDYYFPEYISSKATDGFLVLTVDGVRVATKSTEGEDRSWLVGTRASGPFSGEKRGDGSYSGKISLQGVPYLFVDQPLKNYAGKDVGYISFGLQEEHFSGIVQDNRRLSIFIGLLCLIIFLPLGQLMASQLRQNQEHLEHLVRRRTQELETAVDDLKELNETKSRFLSNITHELRTPLCVIINACDFLKGGFAGTLNEKQSRYVGNALECGNHLLTLINDLLDLTRLNSGRVKTRKGNFSIRETVESAVTEMRSFMPDSNVKIVTDYDPENFTVYSDQQIIRQILYNLLANAIKFSHSDGTVLIRARLEGEKMKVSVIDHGIGIDRSDQERIFSEFEQVDNTFTKRYSGTGLGLPIVKKQVELLGGQIYVTSELGRGSDFTFVIPFRDTNEDPLEAPRAIKEKEPAAKAGHDIKRGDHS